MVSSRIPVQYSSGHKDALRFDDTLRFMKGRTNISFDIFLDESGLFSEADSFALESGLHENEDQQQFASQIAGVICREGVIKGSTANEILSAACRVSRIEYGPRFHANEHSNDEGFPTFVTSFCEQLKHKKIQPVRLVNDEAIAFGDRISTYCNVLAELLVRVCKQLERDGEPEVSLNVYAAKVVTKDDPKTGIEFMQEIDYLARIREVFGRAAIANGFSASAFKWKVNQFQLRSAREDRRLQLADVVSYSSHDGFRPLRNHQGPESQLRALLADFDWTFSFDETLSSARTFLEQESYARALIAIAERANAPGIDDKSSKRYEEIAEEVVSCMESLTPAMQKPQLQIITGWLNQVAEQRQNLDSSLQICEWIQAKLCDRKGLGELPTDWFRLVADTWALTACNHDANTLRGRFFAERMDTAIPRLANRWEYAQDIMFAFVVRAVHQNDCFEHSEAAERMSAVVGYYESLDGFFADAFKGVFPEKVLSDMRARALGTLLQSQIGLLLTSSENLERCRTISDQAIGEFLFAGDQLRQLQYRCELETIAGEWNTARSYLAKSLGLEDNSHDSISAFLASMPDHFGKAFALLHWSRIGSMAAAAGDQVELQHFVRALDREKLRFSPWCSGEPSAEQSAFYPTHGILRHLSVSVAGTRDFNSVITLLRNLKRVVDGKPRPVFQLIQIASHLQCAGLLISTHSKARELIIGDKRNPGAMQLITDLQNQIANVQPFVAAILKAWQKELDIQTTTGLDGSKLLRMGRIVGY